ncbi:hypothetical protein SNOG_06581 [Parastagonospora nodorum SN15]|uniref:Uncharacterized protein n=1 Tax=Phaeosphaeria nodorum (strain SN15 / ATCC MYA-4574 / FGSC 10173) TaxID=321614 RepID=Q0UNT3_PHANO|nr:hypothetical protein SNOG_06581 [Parastagonospora nodorum SN15]EAT86412.1 hypothetical protein SNOG_06581 [Parastagonospora nodorum SN15]
MAKESYKGSPGSPGCSYVDMSNRNIVEAL